jgi:signal transduction histidine kinase
LKTRSIDAVEQTDGLGQGEALSELLRWIAHELNNPLGVILGRLPALMRAVPQQTEVLQSLERNARRCAELSRALEALAHDGALADREPAPDALVRRVMEHLTNLAQ